VQNGTVLKQPKKPEARMMAVFPGPSFLDISTTGEEEENGAQPGKDWQGDDQSKESIGGSPAVEIAPKGRLS